MLGPKPYSEPSAQGLPLAARQADDVGVCSPAPDLVQTYALVEEKGIPGPPKHLQKLAYIPKKWYESKRYYKGSKFSPTTQPLVCFECFAHVEDSTI